MCVCSAGVVPLGTVHVCVCAVPVWYHWVQYTYVCVQCRCGTTGYSTRMCVCSAGVVPLGTVHVCVCAVPVWYHWVQYTYVCVQCRCGTTGYSTRMCVCAVPVWYHWVQYTYSMCVCSAGVVPLGTVHVQYVCVQCRCGTTGYSTRMCVCAVPVWYHWVQYTYVCVCSAGVVPLGTVHVCVCAVPVWYIKNSVPHSKAHTHTHTLVVAVMLCSLKHISVKEESIFSTSHGNGQKDGIHSQCTYSEREGCLRHTQPVFSDIELKIYHTY